MAEHAFPVRFVILVVVLVILSVRLVLLLLLRQLLPLLSIFLLLIFELFGVQDDWLVRLEELDQGPAKNVLVQIFKLLLFGKRKYNVLRFQISVDDTADAVHVVEAQQKLAGEAPYNRDWDAAVVVLFDKAQEILPKHLHRHRVVLSVQGMVEELVEHLQIVRVITRRLQLWVLEVCTEEVVPFRVPKVLCDFIEYFLFLKGRVDVLFGTLLDLEGVQLLI